MTSKVTYIGELRTVSRHVFSGSEIETDAPLDNQGKAERFSPTDTVCTMLASCMLTIIGIAARTHGFDIDGTTAEVTKTMAASPRRIAAIQIRFSFPKEYSARQKAFIRAAANDCPVAKSLHPDILQEIFFNFD